MNKARKNIVVVGFSEIERKSLSIPYIEKGFIYYVNSMMEARSHQGYMLIYDNKDNMSLVDFDKKYRKVLNKYDKVWLYNENYKWTYDKWSRVEKVNRDIFNDLSYALSIEWDDYKLNKEKNSPKVRYNSNKQLKLDELYEYLKDYKTIKTDKISKDLGLNARTIQRYMMDINNLYHNIGYNYSKNEWYIVW